MDKDTEFTAMIKKQLLDSGISEADADNAMKNMEKAEQMMLSAMGISDFGELEKLDKAELKKREKQLEQQLYAMMGTTPADALREINEFKKAQKAQRKAAREAAKVTDEAKEKLRPFVRNAVFMMLSEDGENIGGMSKMGGLPEVPEGFEWPVNSEDTPLTFLMQINFAQAHEFDRDGEFPDRGMLYIFYDMDNPSWDTSEGGLAVIYRDAPAEALSPMKYPAEYDPDECAEYGYAVCNCVLDETVFELAAVPDLPDFFDLCVLSGMEEYDYEGSFEDYDRLAKEKTGFAADEYEDIRSVLCGYDAGDDFLKLGGYPDSIQSSVSAYYGDERVQLCQIPYYEAENVGFMIGDGGRIYIGIGKDELKAGEFGKVIFTVQCS